MVREVRLGCIILILLFLSLFILSICLTSSSLNSLRLLFLLNLFKMLFPLKHISMHYISKRILNSMNTYL